MEKTEGTPLTPLEEEIQSWPLLRMPVFVSPEDRLLREVRCKDPRLAEVSTTTARRSYLAGWWDPRSQSSSTDSRWFIFPKQVWYDMDTPWMPFHLDLPRHFGGDSLGLATTRAEEPFSVFTGGGRGRDLWIVTGTAIGNWHPLSRIPGKLIPAERDLDAPLTLLGALWPGSSRLYAVWGQDGVPVAFSRVRDISELEGVVQPPKGMRLARPSDSIFTKLERGLVVALAQRRRLLEDQACLQACGSAQYNQNQPSSQVEGLWLPQMGWRFLSFDYNSSSKGAKVWQFEEGAPGQNHVGSYLSIQGNQLWRHSRRYQKKSASILGNLEPGRITGHIPSLSAAVNLARTDFVAEPGDQVLAAAFTSTAGALALIANREGKPLGWEPFCGKEEIERGGYLYTPHIRHFVHPTTLERLLTDIRKELGGGLQL